MPGPRPRTDICSLYSFQYSNHIQDLDEPRAQDLGKAAAQGGTQDVDMNLGLSQAIDLKTTKLALCLLLIPTPTQQR